MQMRIVESFNSPAPDRSFSEDMVGHSVQANALWALDGATSWEAKLIPDAPSDAAWLVQRANTLLKLENQTGTQKKPSHMFSVVMNKLQQEFDLASRVRASALANHQMPSAAGVYARVDENANAIILSRFYDGGAYISTDWGFEYATPEPVDMMNEEARVQLLREGKHTPQHERDARKAMNNPDHPHCYWVLGVNPEAAHHAWNHTITLPRKGKINVMLYTDGIGRLAKRGYTPRGIFNTLKNKGPAVLERELRDYETRNFTSPRRHHIKQYDDASLIWAEFTR